MAIEPIKGFYVHDEVTDTDGVAKYDASSLANLDETVSLAGYAPDAKAVREQISDIHNDLDTFQTTLKTRKYELLETLTWEIGNINDDTGENQNGTAYIRSNMVDVPLEPVELEIANGYALGLYFYDENGNYVSHGSKGHTTTSITFTNPKARFTVYKTDYSAISVSDYSNVILNVPYHDYVDVVKAELDTVAESTEKAMDTLKNTVSIDFVFSTTNGYFANKNSGLESTDSASCVTNYIPVVEGQTYHADKVYLEGNRSICAYDANKNFLSAITSSTSEQSVQFTIPSKCCYIKITGRVNVAPILNIKTGEQIKTDALSATIKYSKSIGFTIVTGAYINEEGNTITSPSFDCTDFIEVVSEHRIGSNKLAPTANQIKACFYDSAKRPVSYVTGTGLIDGFEFDVPKGAKYIRANKYTGSGASAKMALWYVSDTPYKWEFEKPDVLDVWKNNTEDTLMGLLNVAGKTPIVSICDDDTTVSAIPALKNICDAKGIKCTFACIASKLVVGANADALKNTLLQYQSEGFHIANHSYSHGEFWRSGTDSFDIAECETDLINAMQVFNEKGFVDTEFLVTPFGGANIEEQALASKWGFNALINSADYVSNHLWQQGRFKIRRVLLTSDNSLTYYQTLIDNAYDAGDWLLFETHTDIAEQWDATLVGNVIDYVQSKNIKIMPINQAYRFRKPCYDLYAIFKNPI